MHRWIRIYGSGSLGTTRTASRSWTCLGTSPRGRTSAGSMWRCSTWPPGNRSPPAPSPTAADERSSPTYPEEGECVVYYFFVFFPCRCHVTLARLQCVGWSLFAYITEKLTDRIHTCQTPFNQILQYNRMNSLFPSHFTTRQTLSIQSYQVKSMQLTMISF